MIKLISQSDLAHVGIGHRFDGGFSQACLVSCVPFGWKCILRNGVGCRLPGGGRKSVAEKLTAPLVASRSRPGMKPMAGAFRDHPVLIRSAFPDQPHGRHDPLDIVWVGVATAVGALQGCQRSQSPPSHLVVFTLIRRVSSALAARRC